MFLRMQDFANFSPGRTNTTPDYSTSSESLYSSAAAAAAAGHMYSSLDLSAQSAAAMSDLMSRQYGPYCNTINEHLLSVTSRAAAAVVAEQDDRLVRSRFEAAGFRSPPDCETGGKRFSPPASPYHGYGGSSSSGGGGGGNMYNRFQAGQLDQSMAPTSNGQNRSHHNGSAYTSYPYF